MAKRGIAAARACLVAAAALAPAGCEERLQDDSFINLYKTTITVAVKYEHGDVFIQKASPCAVTQVGRFIEEGPGFGPVVREVKISRRGRTLHHLEVGRMKQLLAEKASRPGPSSWAVGLDGIQVVTAFDASAPQCSQDALSPFLRELGADAGEEELAGEMALIPAGVFQMGDLSGHGWSDELPVHTVAVPAFRLGKYEVSFAQWEPCVRDAACEPKPDETRELVSRPVLGVSWDEVQGFIRWLNARTGGEYRLPTEAEWEYAARAGTTTEYSWGDDIGHNRASCYGCGGNRGYATAPRGSFAANDWGLHDVHGNAWEWVQDCWNDSYRGAPSDGGAWTSGDCDRRVVRGGSAVRTPDRMRAAFRDKNHRSYSIVSEHGFRLAQDLLERSAGESSINPTGRIPAPNR